MVSYDYVIIGAGSAGCVLAHRLSENQDTSVLLIEAGPEDTSWLDPAGVERVTLQTSTGPTSAYPRFIAVAERVAQGD